MIHSLRETKDGFASATLIANQPMVTEGNNMFLCLNKNYCSATSYSDL